VTSTAGLLSLVYGFTRAESHGWSSGGTLGFVALGAVLLGAFALIESRTRNPLLPLRVLADRNRGASFISSLLVGIALFAMFLFLTYYFQQVLGFSAIKAGFAFLPFSVGIVVGATLSSRLLPQLGPRPLMAVGFLVAAAGLVVFTQVHPHSGYLLHILPAELMVSLGMGTAFVPMSSTALIGVGEDDAGVASALVNTTQQTGGSLGVALLNTVAASATTGYLASHHGAPRTVAAAAAVHGYTTGFAISASLLGTAALVSAFLLTARRADLPSELDVMPAFAAEA